MRHLLTACLSFFTFSSFAQEEPVYELPEVGWTFSPPENFVLADSTVRIIDVSENLKLWSRSMVFKSGINNTIACSIHRSNTASDWSRTRPTEIKRSFIRVAETKPHLQFDSLTTRVLIDGIEFEKFVMTGKSGGIPEFTYTQIGREFKGYKMIMMYSTHEKAVLNEIEAKLQASKFVE